MCVSLVCDTEGCSLLENIVAHWRIDKLHTLFHALHPYPHLCFTAYPKPPYLILALALTYLLLFLKLFLRKAACSV